MKPKDGDEVKIQIVPITLAGLASSAINGIIAYIAVYFFKPLWGKVIKYFDSK